eukprot:g8961.t1
MRFPKSNAWGLILHSRYSSVIEQFKAKLGVFVALVSFLAIAIHLALDKNWDKVNSQGTGFLLTRLAVALSLFVLIVCYRFGLGSATLLGFAILILFYVINIVASIITVPRDFYLAFLYLVLSFPMAGIYAALIMYVLFAAQFTLVVGYCGLDETEDGYEFRKCMTSFVWLSFYFFLLIFYHRLVLRAINILKTQVRKEETQRKKKGSGEKSVFPSWFTGHEFLSYPQKSMSGKTPENTAVGGRLDVAAASGSHHPQHSTNHSAGVPIVRSESHESVLQSIEAQLNERVKRHQSQSSGPSVPMARGLISGSSVRSENDSAFSPGDDWDIPSVPNTSSVRSTSNSRKRSQSAAVQVTAAGREGSVSDGQYLRRNRSQSSLSCNWVPTDLVRISINEIPENPADDRNPMHIAQQHIAACHAAQCTADDDRNPVHIAQPHEAACHAADDDRNPVHIAQPHEAACHAAQCTADYDRNPVHISQPHIEACLAARCTADAAPAKSSVVSTGRSNHECKSSNMQSQEPRAPQNTDEDSFAEFISRDCAPQAKQQCQQEHQQEQEEHEQQAQEEHEQQAQEPRQYLQLQELQRELLEQQELLRKQKTRLLQQQPETRQQEQQQRQEEEEEQEQEEQKQQQQQQQKREQYRHDDFINSFLNRLVVEGFDLDSYIT